MLEEIERRFPDEVGATARSPFRSDTDVSLLASLAQHYGAADRPRVRRGVRARLRQHQQQRPRVAAARRPSSAQQDFLCLADHHDHALDQERLDRTLEAFMAAYFPVAAPWERGN